MDIRVKNLLLIMIAVSLAASLFVSYRRVVVEGQDRAVEIAMDYADIVKLAQMDGIKLTVLLKSLKEVGVGSIALSEDTLDSLEQRGALTWVRGSDVLNIFRITRRASPVFKNMLTDKAIDPDRYYIGFTNINFYNRIKNELYLALEQREVRELNGYLLEVNDDELDLAYLGVGIPQDIYSQLKGLDFKVIPRLKNSFRITPQKIVRKLNLETFAYDDDVMIFDEEEVLGHPFGIKNIAAELTSRNLRFGFIEFSEQLGDKALARYMREGVIRIHSIPPDEMEVMTEPAALSRWMRAVNERSVRLLYVHPFYKPEHGKNLTETNLAYVSDLIQKLGSAGYSPGFAKTQKSLKVNSLEVLFINIGILAAFLLLLARFVKLPDWLVYLIMLGGAGTIFFLEYAGKILLMRKAGALISAVTFPSLSVIVAFSIDGAADASFTVWRRISMVFAAFGIAACGALTVVGLLSDTLFRVGAEQFSGIKLALILPILFVTIYFFLENSLEGTMKKIRNLLREPLSVGHVVLLAGLGAFGLIFILRSGNFGIAVPGFERMGRDILEMVFYARPRTKEFLVGYPLMLLVALYYNRIPRQWLWLPLAVSVVAVISMVNTFTHIHSPLLISIVRSVNGLILGLIVGIAAAALLELGKKFMERYE